MSGQDPEQYEALLTWAKADAATEVALARINATPASNRADMASPEALSNDRRVSAKRNAVCGEGAAIILKSRPMSSFLERGRRRAIRIEGEAESLIQRLGPRALDAASMMEREADDFPSLRYWRSVRKAIARETQVETYQLYGEESGRRPYQPLHRWDAVTARTSQSEAIGDPRDKVCASSNSLCTSGARQ